MATRSAASGRADIRIEPLRGPALVRDYLAAEAALAPFFSGHPSDAAAYRRKAAEVARRLPAERRRRVAEAIRPTSAEARDRLERIMAGDGFFVTTGQQAGLFGGPLYTVYKVLSAVRLARALEDMLGVPVAPLFWIAADDHDWAEVNHTFVLTPQNELRRIVIADDSAAPAHPMSHRVPGPGLDAALAEFLGLLPDTEFAPRLRAVLEQAYRADRPMAAGFQSLLAELFGVFDVLLLDPSVPSFKAAMAPHLRHELERVDAHAELLAAPSARLVEAGYHAQVTITSDVANVFFHDEQGRDRLVREEGGWLLRRTRRALGDDELFATLAARPEAFSPNVLLRPVIESALLPTIAYVGGPAEISYFAQIGCLFTAHDIAPPIVFPRFSVTIVESKVRKVLDKFGMDVSAFQRPFHEVATDLVRDEMPDDVTAALARLREDVRGGYDRLAAAAQAIDPTLRGWLEGTSNAALGQLETAEKKIATHLRKKSEVGLEQLRKAAANLYPEGSPQERVLNPLPFLARYGTELLIELLAAMEPGIGREVEGWTGVRC